MPESSGAPAKPSSPTDAALARLELLKRRMRIASICLRFALALVVLYLPLRLFVGAETGGGCLAGLSFCLLLLAPVAPGLMWFSEKRRTKIITAVSLAVAGLVFLVVAWAVAPSGVVPEGNLSVHYTGSARFHSSALSNIVPEIDQLKVGSYLMPCIDSVIDLKQGARIRALFLDVYREMRSDAAFVEAGSALGACYDESIWRSRSILHFYQYVPRQLGKRSYPVLIFLHGAMGNFKGYTWILKELADAHGYAIVAPTFGAGNWWLDRDAEVLEVVDAHIAEDDSLDGRTVYVAGLSNGGLGVTRAVASHGARYKGFVYISPVMDQFDLMSADFARGCAGKPVLIIHGEEDRRIPRESVRAGAVILSSRGVSVTSRYYEGEDHFLFFSQRASIVDDVARWLNATVEDSAAPVDEAR